MNRIIIKSLFFFVVTVLTGCNTVQPPDARLQSKSISPRVDETIIQGERLLGKDTVYLMVDSVQRTDDFKLILVHLVATQELEYRLPDAETQNYLEFIRSKIKAYDRPGVARLEAAFHDLSVEEVAVYWAVTYREMLIRNTPLMKEFFN
jgi:hypothetical protein